MPGSSFPSLTLPSPLMTSEPGSFARSTIVERKPQIIRQVIEDNDYAADIVRALQVFREEIASRPMQPLHEAAPDVAFWNAAWKTYQGRTWLQAPWYFAETFFYRRLLEAVRYFQPGSWQGRNPFQKQKQRQMEADVQRQASEWNQFSALEPETSFEALLHSCLWGNRADLSNLSVKVRAQDGLATRDERHLILIDHTAQAHALLARGTQRVDFINDNVGIDLLFDLALADFLLRQGWTRRVKLHLKDHPFFVSDAMLEDVRATISLLQTASSDSMQALGARLIEHIAAGQLALTDDPFWTRCLMFRQMPPHLREDLGRSDLVILKGDANYRRLLDDCHWPPTTRMDDVTRYFPAPFLALRTLKSEIVVGLEPGQAEALSAADPTWLTDGERGVIQLVVR